LSIHATAVVSDDARIAASAEIGPFCVIAGEVAIGEGTVVDPGMFTGSEDVSWFAREAGVPLVFWFWGGVDAQKYADAKAGGTIDRDIPTNHSPYFAPVLQPTLGRGVDALVVAAREFLD